jgi:N-succinyldiaminopimelate aminotransferase
LNPDLGLLQPYPFERLRQLFIGITPAASLAPIGDKVDHHSGEIWLPGQRAQARELGNFHSHPVVTLRRRVGESLEDL